MKRIGLILLTAFMCILPATQAQQPTQTEKSADVPAIKFEKTTHDYGRIAEEVGQAVCEFEFTNTGTKPLIINRVAASCGCTTPKYTKEPILPGKKGVITVAYTTTNRVGSFSKTIRVFSNAQDGAEVLMIKGEVLPKK